MPDWCEVVARRLDARRLTPTERDQVVIELASHLVEIYEEQQAGGVSMSKAADDALSEVEDWGRLSRQIQRAKLREGVMNQRTRSIWVPGLISFTLANILLAIFQIMGVKPHMFWMRSGLGLQFCVPWLIAQPVFGAMGAYLSRRAGGGRRERTIAGLFSSIVVLIIFSAVLAISAVLNALHVDGYQLPSIIGVVVPCVALWAGLPAFGLGLGVLPFLGSAKTQES